MKITKILSMLVIGTSVAITAFSAQAEFPERPIKVSHTSAAGAPIDVMMRTLGQEMESISGVPVVVETRPGGSGQVAMSWLKGQPADGHTLHTDATGITSILQLPGAAHDWRDFKPIYRVQLDPFALYVRRGGDYSSLSELIEDMRDRPDEIRIGGFGTGSPHQLAAVAMAREAGVNVRWVPYESGSDAVTDVMSGDLEAAMSNIAIYDRFKEQTQVLAHSGENRLEAHPEVPLFVEEGIDLQRYHWRGVFVHGDTPEPIAEALYELVDQAVQSEGFQKYLNDTSTLSGKMTREAFAELLEAQAVSDREALLQIDMIK